MGIKPAAARHLQEPIREISRFSSYNCRTLRTANGASGRLSTHATADAVDVSGLVTASGAHITLKNGWSGAPEHQAFLNDLQDSACIWFRVTLGPDYNDLHADHFHLQHTGWGLCR